MSYTKQLCRKSLANKISNLCKCLTQNSCAEYRLLWISFSKILSAKLQLTHKKAGTGNYFFTAGATAWHREQLTCKTACTLHSMCCMVLEVTSYTLVNYWQGNSWCVHSTLYTMTMDVSSDLWMVPRYRSGVRRRGRNPLLPGDNVCCRHVHHRCCGNRSGKGTHYTVYSNTPMINLSYT